MPSKLKPVKQLQKKHHADTQLSQIAVSCLKFGVAGIWHSYRGQVLELNLQIFLL